MTLPDFLTRDKYGEILLSGHGITLYGIVRRYQEGCVAEALAEEFPSLPLALLREILAFYLANQTEVDAYVEACRQEIERQAAARSRSPGREELQRRWEAKGLGKLP